MPKSKVCTGIIGFGDDGVSILRNNLSVTSQLAISSFGYSPNAGGWRTSRHLRLVADMNGDKTGDIVGFGEAGVFISFNNNDNTFQTPKLVLRDFAYDGGWRIEKHPRFLADIRRIGKADIVGFGDAGVLVALNNGDGTFRDSFLALPDLGYSSRAGEWRVEKHLRLLGDTTGDGHPDIIAFGENFVLVARNNRDGTFQPPKPVVSDFCYSSGWHVEKHPRFVADLTGDGRVDIVGFGDAGVYVALNNGDGTFQPVKKVVSDFGYNAGGWRVEMHPRLVADLTGDGRNDIIGFGNDGVYVSYNSGDSTFTDPQLVVNNFAYNAGGWRVELHPRFLADLTGDGTADIIGFGAFGMYVSFNKGNRGGFHPPRNIINQFTCWTGWRVDEHPRYPTNIYL